MRATGGTRWTGLVFGTLERAMPTYDARTALLVVDVQNDFADPSGSLYVAGRRARSCPIVNAEVERARDGGALVVYTQDWHPEHTPALPGGRGHLAGALRRGHPGAAFHPDLLVADNEVVRKGHDGRDGYSGFSVRDPLSRRTRRHPAARDAEGPTASSGW